MQKNNRTRKRTSAVSLKVHTQSLSEPFRQKLSNGITVIGESIASVESVAIGVWVNFGPRDERKEENGLTHLIEHMVFKGTEHFTSDEIVGTIEDRGGYINAFTTKEFSCYYAKIFKEDLEETIRVLSDLVLYPKFNDADLRNERKVVLTEMQEVYDDPEDWGMDYIEEKLFAGNSLSMPILGRASRLRRFTSRELKSLHSRKFTADRMVVSVAGNFSRQKLAALSEKYFSGMPASSKLYIRKRPHTAGHKEYVVHRDLGKQAHIIMGAAMPGSNDPERYAASTLGVILGDGSSSRLHKNVREKDGLAYSIYTYGTGYADTGVMGIYACTAHEDIERAEEKILTTVDEFVKNGPTEKEVVRAKAQLKAGIIFSLENLWDRATLFARDELYYREKSRVSESLDSIERVTDAEIADAARKYLGNGGFTTLKILPQLKEKFK